MLKLRISALMLIALQMASLGSSAASATRVGKLRNYIADARVIYLYYYTETDRLRLTDQDLRSGATIVVTVKCENSCTRMMRNVISHFDRSKRMANCPRGGKYLLIDFGSKKRNILYYAGGRISKFNEHCYYSEQSIDDLLHIVDSF